MTSRQLTRDLSASSPGVVTSSSASADGWLAAMFLRRRGPSQSLILDTRLHSYTHRSRQLTPFNTQLKTAQQLTINSNTALGTLAVDGCIGWAITFGTVRRGLGGAAARPDPSSLYQM